MKKHMKKNNIPKQHLTVQERIAYAIWWMCVGILRCLPVAA